MLSSTIPDLNAQQQSNDTRILSSKQESITLISIHTAKGELDKLKPVLNVALDSGMSINEIKGGFPRSIQGLTTFMGVVEERKAKGIKDEQGKEATSLTDEGNKYERGKKTLEALTGEPQREPKTGYSAFSPEIDKFLKEHLFADLFGRDVLSYQDRETATISALICLGGVEPMMQGHMGIALHIGMTESQLKGMIDLVEIRVGPSEANAGRVITGHRLKKIREIKHQ